MNWAKDKSILLFDGHCNLCNRSVQFVLKHSKTNQLYFLSLQSERGKELLKEAQLPEFYDESLVFFSAAKIQIESDAALSIAPFLKWPWSWLIVLKYLPKKWRDTLYRFVSKRRFNWFGKADSCWIMQKAWKDRFL